MLRISIALVVAVSLGGLAVAQPATTSAPATQAFRIQAPTDPTQYLSADDLIAAFAEKNYQLVVREIVRIVQNKKIAGQYKLYALWGLRGEAHMQLRNATAAMDAFSQAAKETTEPRERATAQAMVTLLQKQTGMAYQPKTPEPAGAAAARDPLARAAGERPKPIDLLDGDQRSKAIRAIYRDTLADQAPELRRAMDGNSLPPIARAGKALDDLAPLEDAAEHTTAEIDGLRDRFAQKAGKLMVASVRAMTADVTALRPVAMRLEPFNRDVTDPKTGKLIRTEVVYRRHGLSDANINTLRGYVTTANQIAQAGGELATLLHQDAKMFNDSATPAKELAGKANEVLSQDYTGEFDAAGNRLR